MVLCAARGGFRAWLVGIILWLKVKMLFGGVVRATNYAKMSRRETGRLLRF